MHVDRCYCLLLDLALSMVVQFVWDCNKNQTSALEAGGAQTSLVVHLTRQLKLCSAASFPASESA